MGGTREVEEPRNTDMLGKSESFRVVKLYRQIKGSWGEEVFWKAGLSREDLKVYLDWRGNGFLIGEKRKYQGRRGEKVESFACLMCGSQDESLIHFLCECVELNDCRREMYGKEKLNEI